MVEEEARLVRGRGVDTAAGDSKNKSGALGILRQVYAQRVSAQSIHLAVGRRTTGPQGLKRARLCLEIKQFAQNGLKKPTS